MDTNPPFSRSGNRAGKAVADDRAGECRVGVKLRCSEQELNAVGCGSSCVVCRASDVGNDESVGHSGLLRCEVQVDLPQSLQLSPRSEGPRRTTKYAN